MEEQEPNPLKGDPRDFALWKANKPGEDTSWESPWGRGRPGWHIECSAMAEKYLGPSFEIHGGGLDLKFPHHENEIAQSRALGHDFARIWMHNGMLSMRGSEMHKSLGNDVSLADALDRWGRETLLFFFLTGHWRKPLDYSDETLEQARAQLETFRNVFRSPSEPVGDWAELEAALDDDFNTPEALAVMHALARPRAAAPRVRRSSGSSRSPSSRRRRPSSPSSPSGGVSARDAKDFAEADRLRDEIAAAGWEVRDVPRLPASSSSAARDARSRLRPPPGARGAARAARGARAVGERAGGSKSRSGCVRSSGRGCRRSSSGISRRPPARATTRASSRGASRSATPTRSSSPPARRRSSRVSTRSATRGTSAR